MTATTLTNWSGNVRFAPAAVHRPTTVGQVQAIVAGSDRVRVLGTGHSFNRIADTTGDLLMLGGLPPTVEIDTALSQVRISGAMRYGDIMRPLHAAGLALANTGSLPHISVAGACATGTHGSGDANQVLAASVAVVEMVRADGELVTLRRGDPGFDASAVALGALGAITHLTLDLVPTFDVNQVVYLGLTQEALHDNISDVMASAYSVSVFTDHIGDARVWRKRTSTEPAPQRWLGAHLADTPAHPIPGVDPLHCTQQLGAGGPWFERLPHFRLEFTPSRGDELQSEYLVPREHAAAALTATEAMAETMAPVLLTSELRTVAADELWLSPASGRDSFLLHFSWADDAPAVDAVVGELEARLHDLDARPHWGKVHTMGAGRLRGLYPRFGEFAALATGYDPTGKFRNAMLDTLLG